MAEKKGVGHAYNVDFLNVVFAASSLFLFLSVVWMVWDDYDRDWKNTQRHSSQLAVEVTRRSSQADDAGHRSEQATSSSQAQEQGGAEEHRGEPAAGRRDAGQAQDAINVGCIGANAGYQSAKATYDQDRYDVRGGARGESELAAAKQAQEVRPKTKRRVAELNLEVEKVDRRADRAAEGARPVHRQGRRPQKQIEDMTRRADRLRKRARRHRAERGEGLLPERAAARLHGADAQGSADHPAERRRRRELHHACRRWIGARPAIWRSTRRATRSTRSRSRRTRICDRTSAATRRIRSTRPAARSATRGMGQSVSFRDAAHAPSNAKQQRGVGREVPLGRAALCGTTRCCRRT